MDYVTKERIPCTTGTDVECNCIELKLYYDLGGYNYFTYTPKKRGYYISVKPLMVKGNMYSFTGFTGFYDNLVECNRKSKKAEAEALKLFKDKRDFYINACCNKHGIKLIGDN